MALGQYEKSEAEQPRKEAVTANEAYIPTPQPDPFDGPQLRGFDWLEQPAPSAQGRTVDNPVLVVRLEGERVVGLSPQDLAALRSSSAKRLEPLTASVDLERETLDVQALLAHAKRRGAGALALLGFEGEGASRQLRVRLFSTFDGRLVLSRDGLLPSLEVAGSVLAERVRAPR